MSGVTDNYGLILPEEGEPYDVLITNSNNVEIDEQIKIRETDIGKLPKGIVSYSKVETNSGSIDATFTVINNVATFTFKGGRRYKLAWEFGFQTSIADSVVNTLIGICALTDAANLTTGITQFNGRSQYAPVTAQNAPGYIEAFYTPVSDDTKQVKWIANVTSGTLLLTASATNPNSFIIYDEGAYSG